MRVRRGETTAMNSATLPSASPSTLWAGSAISERTDARLPTCLSQQTAATRQRSGRSHPVPPKSVTPVRRARTAPGSPARHRLPGLNGRAVRNLRQVRAVRSLLGILVSSIAAVALMVSAGVGLPAYAEAATQELPPVLQTLTVDTITTVATVDRDAYTVTAPPPLRWPLNSLKMASGYGARVAPCGGCSSFHEGVDFDPGFGAPIYAIAAGVVVEASTSNTAAFGTYVVIRHVIDGTTIDSAYGHMKTGSMPLSVGEEVKVGQQIGNVGSTGVSTGPHLHFELRINGGTINPLAWMHARLG